MWACFVGALQLDSIHTHVQKVFWFSGLLTGYVAHWICSPMPPASPSLVFLFSPLTLHCGEVTDFKISFLSSQKVLQIQNLHELKIQNYNWAHLQFEVTCQQFYCRLSYNGSLTPLGPQGNFSLQYHELPLSKFRSKAERPCSSINTSMAATYMLLTLPLKAK